LPAACRPKKIGRKKMLLENEMRRNRGKSRSNLQNGEVSGAASAELLRRRFPTSFVTTHGACRPRTPISLVLPTSGTLPFSSAHKSRLPTCSTACASSVEVLLTSLHHRLLDALRATLWPTSPPHVAAVLRAYLSRSSPKQTPHALVPPVRGAPAAAASACERLGP
jgi:hypothetical protein